MSKLLLPLLIVVEVYISGILGIITLLPIWFIVGRTMANISFSNASLLLAAMCNRLGKSLPSWFTLCRCTGTYCDMLYSHVFGDTTEVTPKNKPPEVTVVIYSCVHVELVLLMGEVLTSSLSRELSDYRIPRGLDKC